MARTRSKDAHNRVLEAALELFVERGIEPTTMDALAAASGVSKATIYKHWPGGKEPLLMEVLLLIVGVEDDIPEQDTGDLVTDLARVLSDKPRHARPEDQKRLMPQMVAYSALHHEFGNAWRTRVMERPRKRLRRILTAAMSDGRLPSGLDMNHCFALLLGPLMYRHIFGRQMEVRGEAGESLLGTAKSALDSTSETPAQAAQTEPDLGAFAAEAFCRAFEKKDARGA